MCSFEKGRIYAQETIVDLVNIFFIVFAVPSSAQFSQTERTRLLDMLTRTQKEIVNEAKGLSAEQLNFKTEPERWSIAEVLDSFSPRNLYSTQPLIAF